jgi:methyltransferase
MIVEARRAARNEAVQRANGGIEPSGDVYRLMKVAYPAVFLAMIAEGAARASKPSWFGAGVMLFILAKGLKWWAIRSLGDRWTFRLIMVPGASRVSSGPYRFVRHPNYVAVIGELVAVWVMSGARISGPIGTAAFALLVLRRIAVEDRALDAILRPS